MAATSRCGPQVAAVQREEPKSLVTYTAWAGMRVGEVSNFPAVQVVTVSTLAV